MWVDRHCKDSSRGGGGGESNGVRANQRGDSWLISLIKIYKNLPMDLNKKIRPPKRPTRFRRWNSETFPQSLPIWHWMPVKNIISNIEFVSIFLFPLNWGEKTTRRNLLWNQLAPTKSQPVIDCFQSFWNLSAKCPVRTNLQTSGIRHQAFGNKRTDQIEWMEWNEMDGPNGMEWNGMK